MSVSPEKKVGLFFLVGMVIFGIMLEVGEKWNPFEHTVVYNTYLSSITGLKVGDPVRLAGVDVGKINKIRIADQKIRIDFEVKPGTVIKIDSVASLRLTNLLGGQFLGISFGSSGAPLLPPGGTLQGKDVANMDSMWSVEQMLASLPNTVQEQATWHTQLLESFRAIAEERLAVEGVIRTAKDTGAFVAH